MGVDISAEIVINKPRDEVAGFASDPENDSTWIGGIVEAKTVTDPRLLLARRWCVWRGSSVVRFTTRRKF